MLGFSRSNNDLFTDRVECSCLATEHDWQKELKCKHKFQLRGYYDHYFFSKVNAKPRSGECANCGRKYSFQWFPGGVDFTWLDEEKEGS